MLAWCDATGIPCHILLTKADKLKRGPAQSTLLKVKRDLPSSASIQVFSSTKKTGLDELLDKLSLWYEYDDKES
jgi:GTP-binding protein